MATIKSYTDLEQSKTLAEILPLESADMVYIWHATSDNPAFRFDDDIPPMILGNVSINEVIGETLPCWSLSALLNVLPTKLQTVLAINDFQGDRKEKYVIGSVEHDKYDCYADNPVDACVEMILKLNELNLL